MGSKGPDTSGQNEAARMSAEIAKDVWENYKQTYLPMEKQYVADAQNYDTPEHREQEAQRASADVEQAYANTQGENERNMEGMGIRPDDAKFAAVNARLMRDKAAQEAGAQNMARQRVEQTGWDRRTGALSLGKGLPAQASNAASQAGAGYANANKQEFQNDQAAGNNLAQGFGAVGSAMGWFDDGGLVDTKKIGIRLAMGGPAGLNRMMRQQQQVPDVPTGGGGMGQSFVRGAKMGRALANGIRNIQLSQATPVGEIADGAAASPADVGIIPGAGTAAGIESAADATGAGMGSLAEQAAINTAAAGGADAAAAGTAAAGTAAAADAAAAGTTAATTGMAAMGPLGWAGLAALGISALLRKDGGGVGRVDGTKGGHVNGPGTETSDSIPAMLSDGEYVLNADAVKHFGLDRLEKMNQVGLQKRYGIKR